MDKYLDKMTQKNMKKSFKQDDYEPDEAEFMLNRTMDEPINMSLSVFDRGTLEKETGINSEASVFDGKAIFRTSK
ncbi:MAG: hypothetical protein VB018_00265 [Lachnospiraceae bacterium]|nr:hypothetical protein [Lachnospiraceae bacterium]